MINIENGIDELILIFGKDFEARVSYRIWKYSVSHSTLILHLVDLDSGTVAFLIFSGVQYMSLSTMGVGLYLAKGNAGEIIKRLNIHESNKLDPVIALHSNIQINPTLSQMIVAKQLQVFKNLPTMYLSLGQE